MTLETNYFRRHVNTIITVIKPLIYFEITQFSISLNCLFWCVTTISCTQLVLYNFCYTLHSRIETVYNTSKIFDMKWKIVSLQCTFGRIYVDYMDLWLTVKIITYDAATDSNWKHQIKYPHSVLQFYCNELTICSILLNDDKKQR